MTTSLSQPAKPKELPLPIFIFDGMRTRSHLFFRYLCTNPVFRPIYHPFIKAGVMGEERWVKRANCCEARRKMILEEMVPFLTEETYESLKGKLTMNFERVSREVCLLSGKTSAVSSCWTFCTIGYACSQFPCWVYRSLLTKCFIARHPRRERPHPQCSQGGHTVRLAP